MLISGKNTVVVLVLSFVFALNSNVYANCFRVNTYNWLYSAEEAQTVDVNAAKDEEKTESCSGWDIIGNKLLWYLPNCFVDLADCFTVEVGAGDFGLHLYLTDYVNMGANVGYSYNAGWAYKRQYGIFKEVSYNAELFRFNTFEKKRRTFIGNFGNYDLLSSNSSSGFKYPENNLGEPPYSLDVSYLQKNIQEDPYAIGFKASLLVGVKFQFHAVEFADFICGLFFYDLNNDNYGAKCVSTEKK